MLSVKRNGYFHFAQQIDGYHRSMTDGSNRRRRSTLADVAKAAGTSIPTVSKALRDATDVAPETRDRILRAAERVEYLPRAYGSTSRAPERRVIDVVMRDLSGTWPAAILKGVTSAAESVDIDVVVRELSQDRDWIGHFITRSSYGVILASANTTPAERSRFATAGIPVVALDPISRPDPDLSSVGTMNWEGGRSAGDHLVGLGHRNVAVLDIGASYLFSRARVDGFRSAIEDAGAALPTTHVRHAGFDRAAARDHARELLSLPQRPTAFFTCTEALAFGVYDAAAERRLVIPDDLSVVAFDDLPDAIGANPPMTTVRQPFTEIGDAAVRMILRLRDQADSGIQRQVQREELATRLVVRGSTSTARTRIATYGRVGSSTVSAPS